MEYCVFKKVESRKRDRRMSIHIYIRRAKKPKVRDQTKVYKVTSTDETVGNGQSKRSCE